MAKKAKKSFHSGTVKKTITVKASKDKVWRKISNIVGLSSWLVDVTKTEYLSIKKGCRSNQTNYICRWE